MPVEEEAEFMGVSALPVEEGRGDRRMAVVLGVERPLGRVMVDALLSESREVRAVYLEREFAEQGAIPGTQTIVIDPTEAFNVSEACRGGNVVYDCYEPNYSDWKKAWPLVTSNVVLAAIDVGSSLVFASHLLRSESENERQEAEILRAHKSGLIKTVVARLPQLTGVQVMNPLWKLIYDSVLAGKKAHWIGDPDVPRSLLDVEDAARAMIQLADSPQLSGRAWEVASPSSITGRQFIEDAFKAVGRKPEVGSWGRGIVLTGGLLASDAREVLKMPYDYYAAFELNGRDFADALPSFYFTSPEKSISKGILWYREHALEEGH
jgi:hypothetical protein